MWEIKGIPSFGRMSHLTGRPRAEESSHAEISLEDYWNLLEDKKNGVSINTLARKYKTSPQTVCNLTGNKNKKL